MQSATLDTNVYISALNYGGICLRILDLARNRLIRLELSNSILEEVGGVLRDKFQWPESEVQLAQRHIALLANQVSPRERLIVVADDPITTEF